ncbi:hypothetical protein [Mycobacteroides abscessus]|uniref:hypothetical protein n=1 Tax=Mycobacteroides abscessus TaxID=36809 RepID=UPI000C256E46|nr:hypothetical protein [Mycobacteroides abscessus]
MKSHTDGPAIVEKYRRRLDWLTSAESLLIPAVPAAVIWAITADQQVRETELNPFQVDWNDYGAEAWIALAVTVGVWATLVLVFWDRLRHMRKLVAITKGHQMEEASRITASNSADRRKRVIRDLGCAPLLLWFLSVVALPMPAVWQISALIVGTWLAWEWRTVEKVEAFSIEAMCQSAREAATEKQKEMFD